MPNKYPPLTPPPRIDTEYVFIGRPSRAELAQAFREGFDKEEYMVKAIRLHLMSEADKRIIEQQRSSIEDMLNGRSGGEGSWVLPIYERWNALLGFRCFGS